MITYPANFVIDKTITFGTRGVEHTLYNLCCGNGESVVAEDVSIKSLEQLRDLLIAFLEQEDRKKL